MRTLLVFLLVTATSTAMAGGWSWEASVDEFTTISDLEAVIVLAVPEGSESGFGDCRLMQISVRFKPDAVFRSASGQDILTVESHKKALKELRGAFESSEKIRFGSMGSGLKKSKLSPCSFKSNGLALLEEHGGGKAVYSFHNPV